MKSTQSTPRANGQATSHIAPALGQSTAVCPHCISPFKEGRTRCPAKTACSGQHHKGSCGRVLRSKPSHRSRVCDAATHILHEADLDPRQGKSVRHHSTITQAACHTVLHWQGHPSTDLLSSSLQRGRADSLVTEHPVRAQKASPKQQQPYMCILQPLHAPGPHTLRHFSSHTNIHSK